MLQLAVFASTRGTDLQAIIDALKKNELAGVELKFVLSNKKDAYALERAKLAGFKTYFVDPKGKTREEYDKECLRICQQHKVDLILFIGYMRIVTKVLVDAYRDRIINIHPSLLPKYPGMDLDVHKAVLQAGEKETGCTLHFVDETLDGGPIIRQAKVKVAKDDTPESLKAKVQEKEKEVIVQAIKDFRDGKIRQTLKNIFDRF